MGPKSKESSKTTQKKNEKIIEDKTFGLKNKKGSKQQKYIQQVERNVTARSSKDNLRNDEKAKRKEEKNARDELLKLINKPVVDHKALAKGVDPKSVVCVFHRQGICTKGSKCKFSHDLTLCRKPEKKSIYTDEREVDNMEEEETMEGWDEKELNEVVAKKHGDANRRNAASKVCKYFLEAVEKQTYGWFWECPNGNDKCIYKHSLPVGYVLKRHKKEDEAKVEISLVELIETERAKLMERPMDQLTRVTLETFLAWKRRKVAEKSRAAQEQLSKRRDEFSQFGAAELSGRDMFHFNLNLASREEGGDDGEDADEDQHDDDVEQYTGFIHDIDDNAFAMIGDENLFLVNQEDEVASVERELDSVKMD